MSDNNDRLKDLQWGELESPKHAQTPAAASRNTANVANLQSSETESIQRGAAPKQGNPNWPNTPTLSQPPHAPTEAMSPSKVDSANWLVRVGIGAAAVVGVIFTLLVSVSILSTDSTTADSVQSVEEATGPDEESGGTARQGTPVDIPVLAASVTRSTVLIECPTGFGSGFLLDAEPLTGVSNSEIIVTNQHVIEGCEGANELVVSTATSMSRGSVIAFDTSQDLAIIDAPELTGPSLAIGPVPVIGQWAMAVGNPDGITDTATFGNITNVKLEEGFILSDVLVGPGNSGGPLVDNQGRVLGVNTAVLRVAEGFSISVPIENLCDRILECR